MAYSYDPQIAPALAGISKNAPPKRGDWKNLRDRLERLAWQGSWYGQRLAFSCSQPRVGVVPANIEVGELDIFRNENMEYARRIACAGISMELHVHAGAPHAFDLIAPHSDLVKSCMADRVRALIAL
jgi:acetyl esterase/lipase